MDLLVSLTWIQIIIIPIIIILGPMLNNNNNNKANSNRIWIFRYPKEKQQQ